MDISISKNDDLNRAYDDERGDNHLFDQIAARNNYMSRSSIQPENFGGSGTNQINSHERIKSLITLAPMNMDNLPSNPFSNSFGIGYDQNSLTQKVQVSSNLKSYGNGTTYDLNDDNGGIPIQKFTNYPSNDQNRIPATTGLYESKYKQNITSIKDIYELNFSSNPFNSINIPTKTNNGDHSFQKASSKKCFLCQQDTILTGNGLDFDICNICKKQ